MATSNSASKAVGVAGYWEFRKDTATFQFLAVPQVQNPSTGEDIPARIYLRQISEKSPKKPWKSNTLTEVANDYTHSTVESAVTATVENLASFALMLNSTAQAGWDLVEPFPVAVEVGPEDVAYFLADETPEALFRRMANARIALKYPEKLFYTQAEIDAKGSK